MFTYSFHFHGEIFILLMVQSLLENVDSVFSIPSQLEHNMTHKKIDTAKITHLQDKERSFVRRVHFCNDFLPTS